MAYPVRGLRDLVFPNVILHEVGRVVLLCVIHKNWEAPYCLLCLWDADQAK